jgi:hypothetical protein
MVPEVLASVPFYVGPSVAAKRFAGAQKAAEAPEAN